MQPTESILASPWNHAVCLLETYANKRALGTGSGFFWNRNGRAYLLTNWHILAGRNTESRQPLHSSGALPDEVHFTAYRKGASVNETLMTVHVIDVRVDLYKGSDSTWFRHPREGVDVAGIDVTGAIRDANLDVLFVNELESNVAPTFTVSQDAFVVGYPFGRLVDKEIPVPVWKRGTIATDPTFNPSGREIVLVDTGTRSGMSGSVVIARHVGRTNWIDKSGAKIVGLGGRHDSVLGIYAGRYGADNVEAQLGIVWKRHLIEQACDARCPGTNDFRTN
jgi:hypothetical protein